MHYSILLIHALIILGVCTFSWFNWRRAAAQNRFKTLNLIFMILTFIGSAALVVGDILAMIHT